MIVIDANILIYALIESDNSRMIPLLRTKDADWRTAGLCLHETLNVLATYQRRGLLTLEQCRELLKSANHFSGPMRGEYGSVSCSGGKIWYYRL
jgi:predicted nucleic acid-binding protein